MSSIRLFVLGSLAERGPMHGHALRHLAEEEHIDNWADFGAGAIYGAIKRLAAEGLIAGERVEREGLYPERSIYRVTDAGLASLASLRSAGLQQVVLRPDPVDLALTRLDPDLLDDLEEVLAGRLAELERRRSDGEATLERISGLLTVAEIHVMRHRLVRLTAEIDWHAAVIASLPDIIHDEKSRRGPR